MAAFRTPQFSPSLTVPRPIHWKKNRLISCSVSSDTEIKPIRQELCLNVGTHLIPHPKKVDRGGEDAFLVSSYSGGLIAVADGVSGWAEQNIDPSLFPKELLSNASKFLGDTEVLCSNFVLDLPADQNAHVSYFLTLQVKDDPQILIKKAHADTSSKGSATVIVAMLETNGTLKVANVGDCGLRVIRRGQIVFTTSPQEHYFDCPYQLSSEVVGQTYLDAMVCSVNLKEGDTVVMGSDGLFDNLFDQEIVTTVSQQSDVFESAKALAILANAHSTDTNFDSPYIIEARSRGFDVPSWKKFLGVKLTGGKLDDITVVVGRVQRL